MNKQYQTDNKTRLIKFQYYINFQDLQKNVSKQNQDLFFCQFQTVLENYRNYYKLFQFYLMILVEAKNNKDQSFLDQEFDGEDGTFLVPLKKTDKVLDILRTIFIEERNYQIGPKINQIQKSSCFILSDKVFQLLDKFLRMKVSLQQVREILKLISKLSSQISMYQQYVKKLSQILQVDVDHAQMEKKINLEQNKVDIDLYLGDQNYVTNIYNEIDGLQEKIPDYSQNKYQKKIKGNFQPTSKNINNKQSTSLNQEFRGVEFQDYFVLRQNDIKDQSDQQIINVCDEKIYDHNTHNTNSTLYFPYWKQIQNEKNKNMNQYLAKTQQYQIPNQSGFIQDLSRLINPLPSALNNQTITDIIRKQEKDDKKKFNYLKNSIKCISRQGQYHTKMYDKKIRQIKFQKKLESKKARNKNNKKTKTQPTEKFQEIKQKGIFSTFSNYFRK